MSLPTPEAGLVIPYNYLWRYEHRKGQDEGRKTRPAVIVLVVRKVEGNAQRVTVAPITHTPPDAKTEAIELPPRVKHALRLDEERSWIILDEVNEFHLARLRYPASARLRELLLRIHSAKAL